MSSVTAQPGPDGSQRPVSGVPSLQSPQASVSPSAVPNGTVPPGSRPSSTAPENALRRSVSSNPPNGQHDARQQSESQVPAATKPSNSSKVAASPEYEALSRLIKDTSAETVRQVVRDNWHRCLQGSDFHSAFILNTIIHHANPKILESALQEFGRRFIQAGKIKLAQHFTAEDMDDVAWVLLGKASNDFLDKALARRVETIPGRDLVNALARAERLGYDVRDVMEGDGKKGHEHVAANKEAITASHEAPATSLPQRPSQPTYQQHAQMSQPARPPPPPSPQVAAAHTKPAFPPLTSRVPAGVKIPPGVITCDKCGRPCSNVDWHKKKDACSAAGDPHALQKPHCIHCGLVFTNSSGLAYHTKNNVCGEYSGDQTAAMRNMLASLPHVYLAQPRTSAWGSPAGGRPVSRPFNALGAQEPALPQGVQWENPGYFTLSPDARRAFDQEMAEVEEKYGGRMREVLEQGLPQAVEEVELSKLKNSMTTRQSTLRKKYGISRARGRRPRAEVDAEQARIMGGGHLPATGTPVSAGVKRASPAQDGTPRKRVPLDQMGGLSGASASAEMTDPTLNVTPSQPRMPPQAARPEGVQGPPPPATPGSGSRDDPMNVDEGEDGGGGP